MLLNTYSISILLNTYSISYYNTIKYIYIAYYNAIKDKIKNIVLLACIMYISNML